MDNRFPRCFYVKVAGGPRPPVEDNTSGEKEEHSISLILC